MHAGISFRTRGSLIDAIPGPFRSIFISAVDEELAAAGFGAWDERRGFLEEAPRLKWRSGEFVCTAPGEVSFELRFCVGVRRVEHLGLLMGDG